MAVLLLGVAGAAILGGDQGQDRQPPARADAAAEAVAHRAQLDALRRLAEADSRTDRGHRSPLQEAVEDAEHRAEAAEQRLRGADRARTRPAEPAPSDGSDDPAGGEPADPVGPVPASCGEYGGNRATGCALLLEAGYSLDQMACLEPLWSHESGWNHRAQNPSSGAYGIPQALPGDKMASHGDDWQTNPATQIRWGLDYIRGRYGTPCGAWQFWQANNWY